MTAKMRFSLKAGERIFINGAVLSVSQKVTLSLLNDARFLLESHVLQLADATTPMRQLYFVVQSLLINPQEEEKGMLAFRKIFDAILTITTDETVKSHLKSVSDFVAVGRMFEALKVIRSLFEAVEPAAPAEPATVSEKAA
ncbi:flagellar biosynthesis repressor FlbT [Microvirga sp. ACRRW]|uniref:flagellar biosynthesis repressor FlbT n=1 Tax=Microvirga sp. ACRRW TaxID=2918205 RepID=UPI001EF48467|nr:flagellar biosynthesis repressor FlbT [Microvirga sp. ACRRW]MCG7392026.1 flagellar biosynthesis repressor FlbT [Microvirga sp. ACRRW]